ncbi:MAG: deiodinase-like protein [Psychromonas sp.]
MNKSTTDSQYNYKNFKTKYYEMTPFINVAPRVGECVKDFTAFGLDGKQIKLSDFKGKRIILETGSVTCPMFGNNIEGMNRVAEKFTDENTVFLMLYVREAHPGEKLPAHQTQEDKIRAATSTAELSHPNRIFLVDDIKGSIHKEWGEFPNSLWVINEAGRVNFRSDWNDWKMLEGILDADDIDSYVSDLGEHHDNPKNPLKLFMWVQRKGGWQAIWDLMPQIFSMIKSHMEVNKFYAEKKFVRGNNDTCGNYWDKTPKE